MAILRDHSNRDLRVFGDVTVQDAVLQGMTLVKYAKGRNNRNIIWFGESHTYSCDVNRRQALFDHFYPDEGVILVSESGLATGAMFEEAKVETVLVDRRGGVTEAADRTSYGVAERNRKIADAIVAECAKDAKGSDRPVVIFFGDDHLKPIKTELIDRLPANDVVEWWDAPPISDTLFARATTALPSAQTHSLICGARENWGTDGDELLLQRSAGVIAPGEATFLGLAPVHFQMRSFDPGAMSNLYALFVPQGDGEVRRLAYMKNPQGPQARTFQYLNHRVPSLKTYTVVYVKSADIFAEVAQRAEDEG